MEHSDSDCLSDEFEQPLKKNKLTVPAGDELLIATEKECASQAEGALPALKAGVRKKKIFQCQYCPALFAVKSNCTRHEGHCSANKDEAANGFICDKCSASYSRKDNLRAHLKKCTGKSSNAPKAPRRKKPCLVKGCELRFVHHTGLIEHLRTDHQNEVSIKPPFSKVFPSIKDFNVWKEKEEMETFSYFTKRRGTPACGDQHFYCQHDGSEKLHSKRKSSRCNLKGKVKVGHLCIAKMVIHLDPESKAVHVKYYPTHSHQCKTEDILHHPLPHEMSRFIDEKLSQNIPPTTVYELTKAHFLPKNDSEKLNPRANILTKKRVLERGKRRRMARRLHKDDAKAVYMMVKNMMDNDNCILIYKPYGSGVEYGPPEIDLLPNSKDLFMLGIQTQRQFELFKKHCNKIVILDETHGTNQYRYSLLTAMVVDENRRGWPVAHLITSKSDAATLKFFFERMKLRLGNDVSVNCVITDDDPALINAMNEGFAEKLRHLLCIWHVLRSFKDNARYKVKKDLLEAIMSEVKLILNVKEESLFQKLCTGFVKKYENSEDAADFVKYFQKYYVNRSEKWAMCFRNFPHAEVNTTGHIESFHNRLKKFYLKRKVNKRLDDLVTILLDMEWDDHLTRQREATIGFSALPSHMLERHQRGLAMDDSSITESFLESTWEVKSATSQSQSYVVVRHNAICVSDFCFSKCTKLECHGLCAHLYSCSCSDHHPICKHIHKLHSYLTRGEPNVVVDEADFYTLQNSKNPADLSFEDELVNPDTDSKGNEDIAHSKKYESMIIRLKRSVSFFQSFLAAAEEKKIPEHILSRTDAVLSDLAHELGPIDFGSDKQSQVDDIVQMSPAINFTPNEKLKTQVSQLASFKRPPKKKSKYDPSSLAEKKKTAMESLLLSAQDAQECAAEDLDVDYPVGYVCFTPPSGYVSDPFDYVLDCGDEKISLLDLKALELQLPDEEENYYLQRDPIFKCGLIRSSVINAFISELCSDFEHVSFMSSHCALAAANGLSNINAIKKLMGPIKVVLVPSNLSADHWFIFAIIFELEEIRFYDPFHKPLSASVLRCLSQTISDLKSLFPLIQQWKIKVVKLPEEEDDLNGGPRICHFAQQTAEGIPYSALKYPREFRKTIYCVIAGHCLKRSSYREETCGYCKQPYGGLNDMDAWICCVKCQQWFHSLCVGNPSGPFICQ